MKEDTKFEKSSGNVFADLGLPNSEEHFAKSELAIRISQIITKSHMTQAEAARVMGITQPKVSAITNGNLSGFSLEKLMHFMMSLGRDVEIVVKKSPRSRPAQLQVTYA